MSEAAFSGTAFVHGEASGEIIASDVELSFWGGVDPATGEVIDRHHPLSGQILTGKILVIPGGRGSCSGSGVMLELLLNGKGPAAMVFAREDDILTLGVVIAEEMFGQSIPVVTLEPEDFRQVAAARHALVDGHRILCGDHADRWRVASAEGQSHVPQHVELTEADRAILEGTHGKAAQVAMKIVLRMAALQGAECLINVTQAHIDGCVYTGPGSLKFAEQMRDWGGKVAVPTTLNAISVDHRRWRAQGVDPAFGEPASRLGDAYADMGASPTFTCAPYLLETAPQKDEQIVWAESNAVVFANSVLGARTMKYPDFLDLCIAHRARAARGMPCRKPPPCRLTNRSAQAQWPRRCVLSAARLSRRPCGWKPDPRHCRAGAGCSFPGRSESLRGRLCDHVERPDVPHRRRDS